MHVSMRPVGQAASLGSVSHPHRSGPLAQRAPGRAFAHSADPRAERWRVIFCGSHLHRLRHMSLDGTAHLQAGAVRQLPLALPSTCSHVYSPPEQLSGLSQ
jgi:hypothetical protein